MIMDYDIEKAIYRYPEGIVNMFMILRGIVFSCLETKPEEKLCDKIPSYYIGNQFVRLIPSKHHIRIEAAALLQHKKELTGYKITTKGLLQIYPDQDIPKEVLRKIFSDTLGCLMEEIPGRRLKYSALAAGGRTLQVVVWENDDKLHYSWFYGFSNYMNRYRVYDEISDISVEEFNQKIDELGADCTIIVGEMEIDPVFMLLKLTDSNGKEICYKWNNYDCPSDEIQEFISYIGAIIGESPIRF